MKKKFTKALSLLIAVMLVIAIMPTTFAGDTDLEPSGVKIVYDLYENTDVTGQTTITGVKFPATKGFWAFEKQSASFNINRNNNNGLEVVTTVGAWWSIRVYVPKMGSYKLSLNHSLRSNAGISEIYFGKASKTADVIVGETALPKQIDFGTTSSTPEYGKVSEAGNVNVAEPGEYIIVFKSVAKGAGNGTRQYFRQVILDGCESGTEVAGVIGLVKFGGNDSIKAGDSAELSVTAYDGITATAFTTDSVIYESSDTSILSIDGTTATAHKAGTVTVTANSEGWGNPVETTVTVDPAVPYSNATIVYDIGSAGAETGSQDFITTNGFWEFDRIESSGYKFNTSSTAAKLQVNIGPNEWWSVKIFVPEAGSYKLDVNRLLHKYGGQSDIYFGKLSENCNSEAIVKSEENKVGSIAFYDETTATALDTVTVGTVTADVPGEYAIVFKATARADGSEEKQTTAYYARQFFKEIILDGCTGDEENYVPMLNVTADKNVITAGETTTVTATSTLMSNGTTTITPGITYTSNDVVTVDNSGNVTTNKDGVATVTATATADGKSSSRSVNITVNNKEISDAFNAVSVPEEGYTAPSVTGITESGVIEATKNSDGSYNLTAPETKEGSAFLYWAMGMSTNKRIVSFDATLSNYVPEGNGVNYLVPVYADDVSEEVEEYYNLNGQRIAALPVGTAAPALPEIPGLGGAKEWKKCAGNVYVAEYESVTAYDEVIVNGEKVAYGTKIECKADKSAGTFRFWKKTVAGKKEVVSLDPEYSFYAWEDTTVEAVYGDDAPMFTGEKFRIIIDSFDIDGATGVMAEFIGLENAVEKGIMFTANGETRKMAMKTTDNQFTVVANESGTYKGYAIVGNEEDGFTLITDGEYTK